jgi:hypothetical protein
MSIWTLLGSFFDIGLFVVAWMYIYELLKSTWTSLGGFFDIGLFIAYINFIT